MPEPKTFNDLTLAAIDDAFSEAIRRTYAVALANIVAKMPADEVAAKAKAGLDMAGRTRGVMVQAAAAVANS